MHIALSGSANYGILGQRFAFTCTVSNVPYLNANIYLSTISDYKYQSMWQSNKTCKASPATMPLLVKRGYYSYCGTGTMKAEMTVKKYHFVIKRVTLLDEKPWSCYVHTLTSRDSSNIFSLTVHALDVSLSRKSSEPVLGHPLTLVCKLSPSAGLNSTVQFFKTRVKNKTVAGLLQQEYSECSVISETTRGYNPTCGTGTDLSDSEYKYYVMEISQVSSNDNTLWYCRVTNPEATVNAHITSRRFHLTLWHNLTASLSTSPRQPAYKQKFTLTCTLTNAGVIRASVQFRRRISGTDSVVGTLHQVVNNCTVADNFKGYKSSCGTGTFVYSSSIKEYSVEITQLAPDDNVDWFCLVQDDESTNSIRSNHFKLCSFQCEHGYLQTDICTCNCSKHWTGRICEICSLQCKYGVLDKNTCSCDCQNHWTGDKCDICSLECENGAFQKDTCSCHCEKYWTGDKCDGCSLQCAQHGNIISSNCTCACQKYWTGDKCDKCNIKCDHGDLQDSCTCDCDKYWIGDKCDKCNLDCEHEGIVQLDCICACKGHWIEDKCGSHNTGCENEGKLDDNNCTCGCKQYWSGDKCDTCSLQCKYGVLDEKTCSCGCPLYWTGDKCDICSLECENGDFQKDTCSCRCEKYWTGDKCEQCTLECQNEGQLDKNNCTCCCEKYWTGDKCENCILQCDNGKFQKNNCTCDCEKYWTRDKCDKCSLECQRGKLQESDCMCDCPKHWIGDKCETCNLKCKYGILHTDTCTCDCPPYWIGDTCEICDLQCHNNSTLLFDCTCGCYGYWTGDKCDICTLECENGDLVSENCTCQCPGDWTGDKCDVFIDKNESQRLEDGFDGTIMALIIVALIILAAIVAAVICYKRGKKEKESEDDLDLSSVHNQIDNPVFTSLEADEIDEIALKNTGLGVREEDLDDVTSKIFEGDTEDENDMNVMEKPKTQDQDKVATL
ncbi:protein draper-like [Gigantopelta aegis]|uniref:protein draper-like n=1 Tax=Gigantopelta aegis TaxID=1735272 RepID=UPI001B889127|nr:protein draper-like [Gigantopelta aegis]